MQNTAKAITTSRWPSHNKPDGIFKGSLSHIDLHQVFSFSLAFSSFFFLIASICAMKKKYVQRKIEECVTYIDLRDLGRVTEPTLVNMFISLIKPK